MTSTPCAVCKLIRRRCPPDCIFAPYFPDVNYRPKFSCVHKFYGASNISKMLEVIVEPHIASVAEVELGNNAMLWHRRPGRTNDRVMTELKRLSLCIRMIEIMEIFRAQRCIVIGYRDGVRCYKLCRIDTGSPKGVQVEAEPVNRVTSYRIARNRGRGGGHERATASARVGRERELLPVNFSCTNFFQNNKLTVKHIHITSTNTK
ncbi:hypothetical protein E3N88_41224 [Mikania micrantha]|uniref:LOB domain-containing protein n=1 Tax=Mikania micrantha TaxID=192012 RepID=A0A5N6LPY2_9ASTR|nr:hypothetical protein E3N88_41224 [Mikania micrantha]